MIILIAVLLMALLMVAAIRPHRSELSDFELQRRCEEGDKAALFDWRRKELFADVGTVRRMAERSLVVMVVALLVVRFELWMGILAGVVIVLVYPMLSSLSIMRALPQMIYNRYEAKVFDFIESVRGFTKAFRHRSEVREVEVAAESRAELQHIFERSGDVLSSDERKIIAGAFEYTDKLVKDYMTPRSRMEAIGANEMLGPLVLDDLHKTGHSHFPVLEGDLDHIVGILHLHNLLTLTKQETVTVKDIMEPRVMFIHEEQTLDDALSTCIKHRRHLLVVINEYRETVGVITIEDAVKQLLGREIVDHYDDHDNLAKVAERKTSRSSQD